MSTKPELYKDKVEVSLDGRQIFYLFFGGAVIVGMVFVLGVMVGRRVEARGHIDRAHTATQTDPLAALDRLEGSGVLSFHGALTGNEAPSPVEKTIAAIAAASPQARAAKPEAKIVEPKAEPKVEPPKPEIAKSESADDDKAKKPEKKPTKSDDEAKKTGKSDKADRAERSEKSDKIAAKSDDKAEPKPEKAEAKAEAKPEVKSRYTLQLSSFQDRSEADTFLSSVKAAGYQAYVTEAEVSGKGTFYRVRLGTYRSLDAATDAKADFEKASKKSASIMKL